MNARARHTDPGTSHAAAASVVQLRKRQAAVLRVLSRHRGGLTDVALVSQYLGACYGDPHGLIPEQSESGIRTRRCELVRHGLVCDSGERRVLPSGRKAIVWKARANQAGIFAVAA